MPTSKRRCRGTSGGLLVTSHSVKRGADSSEVHDTNCDNAADPAYGGTHPFWASFSQPTAQLLEGDLPRFVFAGTQPCKHL
jgi:hypothetical protein